MELTIDGARVPIEQKSKKARTLTVSGLSQGTHKYFLFCPREVYGPDLGEMEVGPGAGVFQVHFSQRLKVAYADFPKPPKTEGAGPIRAVLE